MTQYQQMQNDMNSSLYPTTDDVDDVSEDEHEYEYRHYGMIDETQEITVTDCGLVVRVAALCTIKVIDKFTVLYREYGPNAYTELYCESKLKYSDDGLSFDVVKNEKPKSDKPKSDKPPMDDKTLKIFVSRFKELNCTVFRFGKEQTLKNN